MGCFEKETVRAIPQSASLTAPFTQGRLWRYAKSQIAQYTERRIEVRPYLFDKLEVIDAYRIDQRSF